METVHYKRCIHCNNKITNINENYRIETIYDGVYREFRYCCSKCFDRFYNVEYNDEIKTKTHPLKPDAKRHPKKEQLAPFAKKGGENE